MDKSSENEFFALVRYLMRGGDLPVVTDWKGIYEELQKQVLLPLGGTGNRIKNLKGLPDDLRNQWQKQITVNLMHYFRAKSAVDELIRLLEPYETVPVIVKGLSSASYYPEPMHRTVGDVDFLLSGKLNVDEVCPILLKNGFTLKKENAAYTRHVSFTKDKIPYELHRYFSVNSTDSDRELDRILSAAEPVFRDGFYSYDDVCCGLVFLDHIKHHVISAGIGLRQIVDFANYYETTVTDSFWKEQLKPYCDRLSLTKFAVTLCRAAELYLGAPKRGFTEDADDGLAREFMDSVIRSGNFGKKQDSFSRKVRSFTTKGNFFVRLQKGGMIHWKAAQKHKILKPFAWLYQFFRLSGIVLYNLFQGKKLSSGLKEQNIPKIS